MAEAKASGGREVAPGTAPTAGAAAHDWDAILRDFLYHMIAEPERARLAAVRTAARLLAT